MTNEKVDQKGRWHFSPEDKAKILRQHLLEKKPVSEVCEKYQITPTQLRVVRMTHASCVNPDGSLRRAA